MLASFASRCYGRKMRANQFILPRCVRDTPTPIYDMHVKNADLMLVDASLVVMKHINFPAGPPPRKTSAQNSTVSKFT